VNHIQRVAIKGAGPRRSGSVDTEPNFYSMHYFRDETMAVARMAPAEPTAREVLLTSTRATQNGSARPNGGGGGAQRWDAVLPALQNARASEAASLAARLPLAAAPLPQYLIAGMMSPSHAAAVMDALILDDAVHALRRQQLLDQYRLLASSIPTQRMDLLPNAIDLTTFLQMQHDYARHLGLSGQILAPPHTAPSSSLHRGL
jgi:hypothetical protein